MHWWGFRWMGKRSLRALGLAAIIFGACWSLASAPAQGATTTASWREYLGNSGRNSFNYSETAITAANVGSLTQQWAVSEGSAISVQAVESNNIIYWGSWNGNMHATHATGSSAGHDIWTKNLGVTSDSVCQPPSVGVASTAALGNIGSTPVVFVGGANANFYALNATTGAVIWSRNLGSAPAHFIWSSAAYTGGSLYIGVASFCDAPLVQGQLVKLNATTGAVQGTFNAMPNGCVGAGIWGSPAIDTSIGLAYVATGNPGGGCSASPQYGNGVIAIHISTMSLASFWAIPAAQQISDGDFGNTPTLFSATINGVARHLLGVANKNGVYYVLDRANLAAGPVWQKTIAQASDDPFTGGSISPSSWDGHTLYIGGSNVTISGQACAGSVRALHPSTGALIWQKCLNGPVLGAVMGIHGVIFVAEGAHVLGLATSSGATLFDLHDSNSGSSFVAAPLVINGMLFVGNTDGHFFAYGH